MNEPGTQADGVSIAVEEHHQMAHSLELSCEGAAEGPVIQGDHCDQGHHVAAFGTCSPSMPPGGRHSLWHFSPSQHKSLKLNLDCKPTLWI